MVSIGILILRLVVGLTVAAHGAQKLFGWWGGPRITGMTRWLESMEMRPAPMWAWTVGLTEFGAGLMLALGFLTPLAGALLFGSFTVAAIGVHLPKGFWNTNGGLEYPMVMGIAAL